MTADKRRLEYIALDRLEFDPDNPRLPAGRSSDRDEVLRYLLESANLVDLMRSIGAQGFFPGEPLLVTENDLGGYTVVEGNRRYAACWLLNNPSDAPVKKLSVSSVASESENKPSSLPCLVLPAQEIIGFLGYRHITGIQEWAPLAKARYLRNLWNAEGGPETWDERLRWIAKRIGSKADYVARLLTSLELFEQIDERDYYAIPDLNEESLSFSLIALAMNRPVLAEYIGLEDGQDFELMGLDDSKLELLVRWFFERDAYGRTRLGESRNVSTLVAVIQHPEARAALEAGAPLSRAYRLTESHSTALDTNFAQATDSLDAILALLASGVAPNRSHIATSADLVRKASEVELLIGSADE